MSFQEFLYNQYTVPCVIEKYTQELLASGKVKDIMHANKLISYQNMIKDKNFLKDLRKLFNETYDLLNKKHPYLHFSIEGRRKSLISVERKIRLYSSLDKSLDLIRDLFAFRIILFGDETINLIQHCYKVMEEIINYAVSKGYTPCAALPLIGVSDMNTQHNDYFNHFQYKQYIKDYICFPKENGYQSLHLVLVDTQGRYLEIQVRTLNMHTLAEAGDAKHQTYKKNKYNIDFSIEREKIHIHGYSFYNNQVFDLAGVENALVVFKRQKTF